MPDIETTFTMFEKKACPNGEPCGHPHVWHPFIGFGRCTDKTCECTVKNSEGETMATTATVSKKDKKKATVHGATKWHEQITPLINSGATRILLVGPPGTGKSKTLSILTQTDYRVTMTEGTGVEDLIGMYQLKDGETVWVDGPAVSAMRDGKALIIDEIDHHPQEIGSLLYALLDDNPQLMLPTGEMVQAAAGYVATATTNANISVLPEAIIDRFEAVLLACSPHPDAMDGMSKAEAAAVNNYYRSLKTTPYQWAGRPTLRRMRAFSKFNSAGLFEDKVLAGLVFGKSGDEVLSTLVTAGA